MSVRVTVVTAVRNAAGSVGSCLKSVRTQTIDAEHVVVDGASTDGTLEIISRQRCSRLVSEPDRGIYDAMNKGIALATGDVVGTLNADDYYSDRQVLARVASVFEREEVDACYGDLEYVSNDGGGRVVRRWRSGAYRPERFYAGWMPPHPTFFVRRRLYERYGGFNTAFGTAADYELMLRFLLRHRAHAAYIPSVLVCMRTGGASNATLRARLRANRMDREAWRVNGLRPRPWTIFCKPLRKLPQFVHRYVPWSSRTGSP